MTASVCGYCGYSRSVQVAGCDHATLPTAGVCQLPPGHAGDHDPAAQVDPAEGRCALPAAGEAPKWTCPRCRRTERQDCAHLCPRDLPTVNCGFEEGRFSCLLPAGHMGEHRANPSGTLASDGEEMANAFRAMEPPRVGPHLQALIEHMSAHEEPDCPQDDTCECADVADINAACAAIEALAERTYDERAAAEAALAAEREKSALLAAELVELQRQVVGRDEALVVLGTELEQERRECGRLRADNEQLREMLDDAPDNPADLCAACGHHRNDHAQQEGEDEPTCGALADVPVADCDCAAWRAP